MPDNTIVVYRFVFDKLKLSSVPQQERLLFFALGHLANEINALNKQVLWCFKPDAEPPVVARAQVSLGLMYLRLLAGKLKEGYLLLQRHYLPGQPSLATVYDRCLLPDARNALTFLKRYFGKGNNVDTVRTHYSFHYSPEELEAGIALVPDDLELFVSQMQGNTFYYASEVLANQAMIRAVDAGAEAQDVFGQLVQEIRDVARHSIGFAGGFMAAFSSRHKDIWVGPGEPIELSQLVTLRSFQVPWFAFEPST